MRIALDARTIYWPTRRGTGKNLIDLYRQVVQLRPDWRVSAYHRWTGQMRNPLPEPNVQPRVIEMPGDRVEAWERWRLPLAAWWGGADVLHCPANSCPGWMPVPTIVTIHDLIPLDMPQGRQSSHVRRFVQSIQTACRRAARIICPSDYTCRRLVRQFGADPDRITVNPWAPDNSMRLVDSVRWRPVLEKYGLEPPYVIHFGAPGPRKNTAGVIDAWAMIPSACRRQWRLLVVGLDGGSRRLMQQRADNLGIASSVRLHGFADEQDLPTLLSGAQVLAYPSLSEGFGLPIMDAWATCTAVLTSNTTSLPEVAGNAAVLIDPTDVRQIAWGLGQLMRDGMLREELVQKGTERLCRYTWRATAQRFVDAVEMAAAGGRRKAAA